MISHWAFHAATLVLLIVALGAHVAFSRIRKRVAHGDGGNRDLMRAIRAHANCLEQSVPFLVCLAALDILGGSDWLVASLGLGFLGVRLIHAAGMLFRIFMARRVGATLSFGLLGLSAALVLHRLAEVSAAG
jgi:uncharacterized membrane protein YecN with MAPEG domain